LIPNSIIAEIKQANVMAENLGQNFGLCGHVQLAPHSMPDFRLRWADIGKKEIRSYSLIVLVAGGFKPIVGRTYGAAGDARCANAMSASRSAAAIQPASPAPSRT
jgi:hypothetical protein